MDDLFEKLKAAPPVNKNVIPKYSTSGHHSTVLPKDNGNSSPRRESMPPPSAPPMKSKPHKSRSLPPAKSDSWSILTKPFKVLIARKKFCSPKNGSMKRGGKKEPPETQKAVKHVTKPSMKVAKPVTKNETALKELFKSPKNLNKLDPKTTPTKAQQKDFSPIIPIIPSKQLKSEVRKPVHMFVTKRCLVRLARQNNGKTPNQIITNSLDSKDTSPKQRKVEESPKRKSSEAKRSPTAKRSRSSTSPTKPQTSFYIKFNTSPSKLLGPKKPAKKPEKSAPRYKGPKSKAKAQNNSPTVALNNNFKASPSRRTKATKFTRTQLIKAFGKRVFQSHVKIERCRHPLMVAFDLNARASKVQSKLNKSKKLSVSFREQVEIFGSTDSDEQSDDDNVVCTPKVSSSKKSDPAETSSNVNTVVTKPIATPTCLKKVENGKVVGEIEFDASLFINQHGVCALDGAPVKSSTPRPHSALSHKRKEKKSFSPLKFDATPSPRKEQFKLANEKLPPTGLRRLNIDDMEDDDDDDDCEYIVPTELPERRASRMNSGNVTESSGSFVSASDEPEAVKTVKTSYLVDVTVAPTESPEKQSTNEDFTGNIADVDKHESNCIGIDDADLKTLPKLMRIQSSPTLIIPTSPDLAEIFPETCSKEEEGEEASIENNPDGGRDDANNTSSQKTASADPCTATDETQGDDDILENIIKKRIDDISTDLGMTNQGEQHTTLTSCNKAETNKSEANSS